MGKTGITVTDTCPHRIGAFVSYIRNDGVSAPILWIEEIDRPSVITLTNQVVRVNCPACFERIRSSAIRSVETKS
jgi:hypothetical protein